MKRRDFFIAATGIALLLGLLLVQYRGHVFGTGAQGRLVESGIATIGGPFSLVDQTGAPVTDAAYRGKWLLVFFGYTYCPDVCPTTLADVARTLDRLGPLAAQVQPLFITVDPARDTPAALAAYTSAFDERIVGLTGTPEQIAAAAGAYRAYFARVGEGDGYTMDHSAILYVMRPDGSYESFIAYGTSIDEMTAKLQALVGAG